MSNYSPFVIGPSAAPAPAVTVGPQATTTRIDAYVHQLAHDHHWAAADAARVENAILANAQPGSVWLETVTVDLVAQPWMTPNQFNF
jgi:hypothetical protein